MSRARRGKETALNKLDIDKEKKVTAQLKAAKVENERFIM